MCRLLTITLLAALLGELALGADSVPGGSGVVAGSTPETCHVAVLRNGFTIQYVRREAAGAATRLWLSAGSGAGDVVIPSEQIERFEDWQNAEPIAATPESGIQPTASAPPSSKVPVKNLIESAAARHRIDPDFVTSVVKAESGFNPLAVSPKGARGLMQLMPQTAAGLGVANVLDPAANMEGGTKYLRQLLDRYDGDAMKALAAYNAGPQRVQQYGGIPPYPETRAYVARIINDYNRKKLQQQTESASPLGGK